MNHLSMNDRGGITYAASQRIGQPERRYASLSELRMLIDTLQELGESVREKWPEGTDMPPELAARIQFSDYVIARMRGGSQVQFAKACDE